jgi:hypothetical protein
MKKLISFLFVFFLSFVLTTDSFTQSFYTGAIGVTQSNGGRTRIFSNNLTTRAIDRLSLLVAVNPTTVFDYNEDQNGVVNAATVTSPALSDFEVTSTINNSYSNLPPNLEVEINLYGWTNGAYLLGKMTIKNNEANAINAVVGLEIIPQVDGAYGGETVQYDAPSKTTLMNKTGWAGIRFFSASQTALKSIHWVSGYGNDSLYYLWLTQGSFDAPLTAGPDGAVAVLGQNAINVAAGQSTVFYFGVSLGTDQATCISNMDLCQQKYLVILPVELTSFIGTPNGNSVTLDWTTATELNNRGFEVERNIDNNWITVGFVEGKGTTSDVQSYRFIDKLDLVNAQTISYRLRQIDYDGTYSYSNEIEVEFSPVPNDLVLEQNYPNPFNPTTKINYQLPSNGFVNLKIYDAIGNEVATLLNQVQSEGSHSIDFNAVKLTSGIYFSVLRFNDVIKSNKMLLIK